jgi:TetR/AcrR family transcriptional regulator
VTNSKSKAKVIKRDPAVTKERLLKAGLEDFGSKGYGGARTEGIAKNAGCNIRMLYHYFGSKKGLYLACLERVYTKIRASERELNLRDCAPVDAITKLVEFTYDHMLNNKDFVQLAIIENTQRGRFLKKLDPLPNAASGLISTIEEILSRGTAEGVFRSDVDAVQLYISILSLSYLHLSNRHTLSVTYEQDLGDADWLSARRSHVVDMVTAYLCR